MHFHPDVNTNERVAKHTVFISPLLERWGESSKKSVQCWKQKLFTLHCVLHSQSHTNVGSLLLRSAWA